MRSIPLVVLLAACGPKAAPAPSEPLASVAPVELPTFDSTAEADLTWFGDGEVVEADLDGDGAPERYEFTCGTGVAIEAWSGDVRASAPVEVAELMGCSAAVVAMRPDEAPRQLLVAAQDHDEVGPPSYALFARDADGLHVAWSGDGELSWYADGHWTTTDTDCLDHGDRGELVTTTWTMYWTGEEVHAGDQTSSEPIEPGGCAEP